MKLNRHNYEEYFILYLDNELDSDSRREVEAFAKQNPDLKAELDILLQSKLTPDADVSFTDKGSLIRFDSASISLSNYEEWLTSYIDDELTPGERGDVEVFVAGNPAIQRELNLLQLTKLQPEAIVFPHKKSLYRKEETARVISVRWWRIAAAAVLLLGISTTAIVLINNKKDSGTDGIVKTASEEKKTNNNTRREEPVNNPNIKDQGTASVNDKGNEKAIKVNNRSTGNKQKERKEQLESLRNEKPAFAQSKEKQPSNDPVQPVDDLNGIKNNKAEPGKAIASIDPSDKALTDHKEKSDATDVTTTTSGTYNKSDGSDNQVKNSDIRFASENSNNGQKGGLRGFLRKVTRTFEKRTNIKATDEDDRLLVGGLAIKL